MNERADGEIRLWEFTIMNDYHDLNDWLIVTAPILVHYGNCQRCNNAIARNIAQRRKKDSDPTADSTIGSEV